MRSSQRKSVSRKLRLIREAVRKWDSLEDLTEYYVTTDSGRWPRNERLLRQVAPRLRTIASELSPELDAVNRMATQQLIFLLQVGPRFDSPDFRVLYAQVRGHMTRAEGHLRQRLEEAMEAERRTITEYLARHESESPGKLAEADEIAAAVGLDGKRVRIQLRLLKNDGLVQLSEAHGDSVSAIITAEGHRYLEEGRPTSQPSIRIGQVVVGHNYGIQAADVGVVIQGETGLSASLQPLIEQLLVCIRDSGNSDEEKDDASIELAQVAAEAKKHKPNRERLIGFIKNLATISQALALGPNAAVVIEQMTSIVEAMPL